MIDRRRWLTGAGAGLAGILDSGRAPARAKPPGKRIYES